MIKKTIILSDDNKSNKTLSTLVLEKSGRAMNGKIKMFGGVREQRYILGIAVDGKQVLKQNVNFINADTYSFRFDSIELGGNIACVLVKDSEEHEPVVWGSTTKICGYKNRIMNFLSNNRQEILDRRDKVPEIAEVKQAGIVKDEPIEVKDAKELSELFELPSPEELEKVVMEEVKCQSNLQIFQEEMDKFSDKQNFFDNIKDQIEDIFESYPAEERLNEILPDSKWVKVKYDDSSREFVLGLIYEDGILKYIAYGVEGEYSEEPPEHLGEYSQWLPLDLKNPKSHGYWVVYQDKENGDNVPIDNA